MKPAATGNAVLLGLGVESQFGVPAGALVGYDPILPLAGSLDPQELANPQVNRLGYVRAGTPGAKGGAAFSFQHPFTAGHVLEFLQHLFKASVADGSIVKTNPSGSIFEYVFFPAGPAGLETSFWSLLGKPPVDLFYRYGIKFGTMAITVGEEVIPFAAEGLLQHGSDLGAAVPAAGNTGTYVLGPWVRGLVADPTAGSIWLRVESLAPLTFKALQAAAEPDGPTWTAAATVFTVQLDDDGDGTWQNLQSSDTGLDLGVYAENKDPLEGVWPGDATAHGDLAVGDVFELPLAGDWQAPGLSLITGPERFTRAHWILEARTVGAGAYTEQVVNTGTVTLADPVEAARGNGSRYPYAIDRFGPVAPTLELSRDFRDTFWRLRQDRHDRIDLKLSWLGQQLSAALRESIVVEAPSCGVTGRTDAASGPNKIEETVNLACETNDAGDPPVTVTVVTDRDWTPAA